MVDLSLSAVLALAPTECGVSTVNNTWTNYSWLIFARLSRGNIFIPGLIILLILPFFLRRIKWARWVSLTLLVSFVLIRTPGFVELGDRALVHFLPGDSGETVDAIVVLGRGPDFRQSRIEAARDLWQRDRAPLILASGYGDGEEIVQDLGQQGIPATALESEPCSRTTEENAERTANILRPRGVRKIILVTDSPHMMRSLLTFQSFGFNVIPRTTEIPASLGISKRRMMVLREWFGLVGYGLRGRYFPRDDWQSASLSQPASAPSTLSSMLLKPGIQ